MEEAIRAFAGLNLLVIGASHILQHEAWADFFERLRAMGKPGALANGFLSLMTGTLIVAFHNVWRGVPTVLTLIGWAMVIKAVVVFLNPTWGVRSMGRVRHDNSRILIGPGVVMVVLGVSLCYTAWGL